jgi:hypothetical protein
LPLLLEEDLLKDQYLRLKFGEPLSRLGKGLDYGFKPTSKEAGTSFLKRFQTGWGAYDPTMLGSKKNPIPFWSAYNAPARRA